MHDEPAIRRLLAALAGDARRDLARLAQLTAQTVEHIAALIARLGRRWAIRAHKTVIDWERLGDERVVALIGVSVSPQRDVGLDQAARIYRRPGVRSAHLALGGRDPRVLVEAPSMCGIAQFVSAMLAPIDRVAATTTHFLLEAYRRRGHPG